MIDLYKQYGGKKEETFIDAIYMDGKIIMTLLSSSDDFPHEGGSTSIATNQASTTRTIIVEINTKDGLMLKESVIDGDGGVIAEKIILDSPYLYLIGETIASDLENSVNKKITEEDLFVAKLEIETFSVVWTSFLGGNQRSVFRNSIQSKDSIYFSGITEATVFPNLTNKRFKKIDSDASFSVFLSRVNKETGKIEFCTFVDGNLYIFDDQLLIKDDIIYLLGETSSEMVHGSFNKKHCTPQTLRSWDGFLTKINRESGVIFNSYMFGWESNDFPKTIIMEQDQILITGYAHFYSDDVSKVVNKTSGGYDLFLLSLKPDYDSFLEAYEGFEVVPTRIISSNYKLGTNLKRSITIQNTGTLPIEVDITTNVDWIGIDKNKLSVDPGFKDSCKILINDELLLSKENNGVVTIKTKNKTIEIPIKIILDKMPKPTIQWEQESVKLDKFSIFSEKIIDLPFTVTPANTIPFTLAVSAPWIQLKSDTGNSTDQKISVKILGSKLTPWQTNQGIIKVIFPGFLNLDKEIPITVNAAGSILTLTIGSSQATLNGQTITLDSASIPLLKQGRTFVGIRLMGELIFSNTAKISYDAKTQTVYFEVGPKKIELYVGKPYALVNGSKVPLDTPPFIQAGRTFVPLRFISENLDASVDYDSKAQSITITYPKRI